MLVYSYKESFHASLSIELIQLVKKMYLVFGEFSFFVFVLTFRKMLANMPNCDYIQLHIQKVILTRVKILKRRNAAKG